MCLLLFSINIQANTEVSITKSSSMSLSLKWNISNDEIKLQESKSQGPLIFKDVSLNDWSLSKTVGSPSLPFKSIILEGVPKDFKVFLDAQNVFEMPDVAPAPAQEMPCRCDIVPWKFNIDFDETIYNKKERDHITVEYMGMFKGKPLTRIMYSPFSYNNLLGLRFVSEGVVSIKSNRDIERARFGATDNNLVIFTANKFKNSLDSLIKRRRDEGYEVNLFSLEDMGTTFEDVKEFIFDLYSKNKFSYSMIIGHEEIFPTEYVPTRFDDNTPSDMNYYTFDLDNNGEVDVIPDVLYSRISVDTIEELDRFINKTLEFENKSWKNSKGQNIMTAIASDEGYDPTDVEYVRQMQAPMKEKFNWKSTEFFQENDNSTPENVSTRFDVGSIWLNYIGHGSGFAWPSLYGEDFTTGHINNLDSGAVKPVIIDVACQNGRFSNEGRMGESFIRATDGRSPAGAVAYYGGSVDISWDPPAVMAIGVGKALSENNNRRLIDVLWEGQLYLLENYDDRQGALENFVWYHLQGDPLLNLKNLN
jgi:hypothetical protein